MFHRPSSVSASTLEPVIARRQVGVERDAARAGVDPVGVEAVETVAEADLVGGGERQRRVIDLQPLGAGRQRCLGSGAEAALVGHGGFNPQWRRRQRAIVPQRSRLRLGEPAAPDEPQPAVGRPRRTDAAERRTGESIRRVVQLVLDAVGRPGGRGVQLVPADVHQAAIDAEPHVAVVIVDDRPDPVARQAILVVHRDHASIDEPAQSPASPIHITPSLPSYSA